MNKTITMMMVGSCVFIDDEMKRNFCVLVFAKGHNHNDDDDDDDNNNNN